MSNWPKNLPKLDPYYIQFHIEEVTLPKNSVIDPSYYHIRISQAEQIFDQTQPFPFVENTLFPGAKLNFYIPNHHASVKQILNIQFIASGIKGNQQLCFYTIDASELVKDYKQSQSRGSQFRTQRHKIANGGNYLIYLACIQTKKFQHTNSTHIANINKVYSHSFKQTPSQKKKTVANKSSSQPLIWRSSKLVLLGLFLLLLLCLLLKLQYKF